MGLFGKPKLVPMQVGTAVSQYIDSWVAETPAFQEYRRGLYPDAAFNRSLHLTAVLVSFNVASRHVPYAALSDVLTYSAFSYFTRYFIGDSQVQAGEALDRDATRSAQLRGKEPWLSGCRPFVAERFQAVLRDSAQDRSMEDPAEPQRLEEGDFAFALVLLEKNLNLWFDRYQVVPSR